MKTILFYDDGNGFGGHLVSVLDAVKYLLEQTHLNVGFMFFEGNQRLNERLRLLNKQFAQLSLYPVPFQEPKLKTIGAFFSFPTVAKIQTLMDKVHPDVVIIAQGSIEACSLGVLAAKRGGYRTISFIALPQKLAIMGAKLSWLRDRLNLYYYRLPDQFITTSLHAKAALTENGVKSPISLAYYGPDLRTWQIYDRAQSRQKFEISEHEYVVGLVARIQFVHKGHDFLIDAIAKYRDKLEGIKFLIVGDGPDEEKLRSLIQFNNLQNQVVLVPWSNDSSYIYSAIDLLIIPSRFEGLPLVMLEAMYYEVPVIGSNIAGLSEVLPQNWLFEFGDSEGLITTLLRVKSEDNTDFAIQNKERILTEFNVDKFGGVFYQAICQ